LLFVKDILILKLDRKDCETKGGGAMDEEDLLKILERVLLEGKNGIDLDVLQEDLAISIDTVASVCADDLIVVDDHNKIYITNLGKFMLNKLQKARKA